MQSEVPANLREITVRIEADNSSRSERSFFDTPVNLGDKNSIDQQPQYSEGGYQEKRQPRQDLGPKTTGPAERSRFHQ